MPKQIYILTSEDERELIRDALFSKKISELHKEKGIDALFIDQHKINPSNYTLLRSYCQENQTSSIEVIDLKEKTDITSNHFFKIHKYIKENTQKNNFTYISERENKGDLERLLGFLKQGFQVDEIELSYQKEIESK